tara:strand:- start:421 stop:645 length:225 start_codon:yes stop_codon:yes gene_type:complete
MIFDDREIDIPIGDIAIALTFSVPKSGVYIAPWFTEGLPAERMASFLSGAIEALEDMRDGFEQLAIEGEYESVH